MDIHVGTLRDKQEYCDDDNTAEKLCYLRSQNKPETIEYPVKPFLGQILRYNRKACQ